MEKQLVKSDINIKNTKNIDLNWSIKDISRNLKQYTNGEYILIFPFCSKKHIQKKKMYEIVISTRAFHFSVCP